MRFQTVTIFLAGVGLLASSDNEPSSTGAFILVFATARNARASSS